MGSLPFVQGFWLLLLSALRALFALKYPLVLACGLSSDFQLRIIPSDCGNSLESKLVVSENKQFRKGGNCWLTVTIQLLRTPEGKKRVPTPKKSTIYNPESRCSSTARECSSALSVLLCGLYPVSELVHDDCRNHPLRVSSCILYELIHNSMLILSTLPK